jgi:hypothetical protein
MSDDLKKAARDRKVIMLDEAQEVRSLTQSFRCTEDQLRAAGQTVVNSAEAVHSYLPSKIQVRSAI